ncbi:MAG: RidA family protein [Actinomycetota bacterium]
MTVDRRDAEGLATPPGYTHVAIANGTLVFTAGAVPIDADGELVGDGDIEAQTEQVLANLLRQLAAGGAGPDDVVKTTVYVASDHDAMIRVWEVVQRSPIASAPSTLLGVALLGYTGQLVEIEAVAVVGYRAG